MWFKRYGRITEGMSVLPREDDTLQRTGNTKAFRSDSASKFFTKVIEDGVIFLLNLESSHLDLYFGRYRVFTRSGPAAVKTRPLRNDELSETNTCSGPAAVRRYQNQGKRHGKTRSIEVLEVVKQKLIIEAPKPQGTDHHGSISQTPKPHEIPQPQAKHHQEPTSIPTQAPKKKPTVGSFDTPCCRGSRYGIHPPPIEAKSYEIKIGLVRMVQESKFLGTRVENPYNHLDYFERLCDTFRTGGVPHDSIKLILFPFSLGGRASQWERTLPSHLVKSWDDCTELFLNKFYPIQRTTQARRDILNFEQGSHESFSDAWDRLKGYTRDCPHHGFGKGEVLSIFYRGVIKENKWTLDVASKGSFSKLDVDQGELLVENLSRSFESYMEWNDATPLEEPCQDSNLRAFQDELDMRERLIGVQQLEAHLAQANRQREVDLEVVNGSHAQEQWSSYEVQEDQQDLEMRGMLHQLLTEQAELFNKLYGMEEKVKALSSREMLVDHEKAQGLMGASKVAVEETVKVDVPKVEYMGGYSTMHVVSPPKASLKKKGSCGEKALGYGNVENTLALDGYCLDSLFSPTIGKEIENTKGECTKTKEEKSNGNHLIILEPPSCTMTLTPWRYEGGAIEYKVKCKGRTKPFAKVKAILSTELKEKGQRGIQEVMGKVILLELKDPPSVNTPLSLT